MTQETHLPASAAQPTTHARSIFGELVILLLSWVGLVMLIAPGLSLSPVRFVYNPSDSAPRGLYTVEPASRLHSGDRLSPQPGGRSRSACHHRPELRRK